MSGKKADDGTVDLYLRMSLDKTGQELGIDRQEESCLALCAEKGWTVRNTFKDNSVSAVKARRRPAFEALIEACPNRIVMWSVDRLARKSKDLERLIELGVPVHSVAAGPMDLATASGRVNARLLTTVATFEGEIRTERQVLKAQQKAKQGAPHWAHRPFGLEREGSLREPEATYLRDAYEKCLSGASVKSLADWFNDEGLLTTQGNAWTGQALSRNMREARNAGIRTYRGQEVGKGTWEPIVSETTYRAAMQKFRQPSRKTGGDGRRKFLLSALAFCANCGSKIKRGTLMRTGPFNFKGEPMYSCEKGRIGLPVPWADSMVEQALPDILTDPELKRHWKYVSEEGDEERHSLEGEKDRLDNEETGVLTGLVQAYTDGIIDCDRMVKGTQAARRRPAEVNARLRELGSGMSLDNYVLDFEYLVRGMMDMTADERLDFLGKVTEFIFLRRRGKGQRGLSSCWCGWSRRWFDLGRTDASGTVRGHD